MKSPMNPSFNPDTINELNKIKVNISTNNHLRKSSNNFKGSKINNSQAMSNYQDSPKSNDRMMKEEMIQNLNIDFIEKLNSKNGNDKDDEVHTKLNKFREYMKKQKEYLATNKKNNEIINNIQSEQIQESNLRVNLADNMKKGKKSISINLKI